MDHDEPPVDKDTKGFVKLIDWTIMAYYTLSEMAARGRSRAQFSHDSASGVLRKSARADHSYDIFLSHAVADAEAVLGVKLTLEDTGLRVYVDWYDDPQLDRSRVDAVTASTLRDRMAVSRSMIFATSEASPNSKWMPWELGYFDGRVGPDRVAVLPLVRSSTDGFVGQEYLGLYEKIESLARYGNVVAQPTVARRPTYGVLETKSLAQFAQGGTSFTRRY